ncbi:MAG: hypothetical protein ACREBR_05575 [bacterium]
MSIPYSTKVNERTVGQPITNESHVVGIVGVSTYASSTIRTIEVPQGPGPAVTITGSGGPYHEILTGTPTGGAFLVSYDTGAITFSTSQNGNTVLVSYTGTGSEISAEDVNELQAPVSSILSLSLTYMAPFTSATANWTLNSGVAVVSLNGLQDAVSLVAGANVTITPAGNSLIIASTGGGGGGGTPAGLDGSVQFNSLGAFGGDAPHFFWDATNFRLGLFTTTPGSTFDNTGSFALNERSVSTNTTATATDYVITCNALSAPISVALPAASSCARRIYEVKKTDFSLNNVTVVANGFDLIDGAATFPMSVQYQAVTVQSNGTGWWII